MASATNPDASAKESYLTTSPENTRLATTVQAARMPGTEQARNKGDNKGRTHWNTPICGEDCIRHGGNRHGLMALAGALA
jgi:hypothetical protein